jgi:hypothetical protein
MGNELLLAGSDRDTFRAASMHGLRIMAFLAQSGLLERGKDPVLFIAENLGDVGYDVEVWDEGAWDSEEGGLGSC